MTLDNFAESGAGPLCSLKFRMVSSYRLHFLITLFLSSESNEIMKII